MRQPFDQFLLGTATRGVLAGVRRRCLVQRLIDGLCRGALLASAMLLLVGLVDRWRPLGAATRAGALSGIALILLLAAARLLRRAWREHRDPLHVGRLIERTHPPLRDRLVTLLAPATSSPALLRELADLVEDDCAPLRASRLLPLGCLLRPLRLLAIPAVALAALTLWLPGETSRTLARLVFRLRDGEPRDAWTIVVVPGDVELRPGQSLRIEARRSLPADRATLATGALPRVIWQGGGVRRAEPMTQTSDGFIASLADLVSDTWYEVEWDGRRSPRHRVRLLHPPGVRSMTVEQRDGLVVAGIDPSAGRVSAPAGSRVELAIEATQPLASAVLESGRARVPGSINDDGSRATFVLPIERDGAWRLRLEGRNGLESDPRLRVEVVAIADEPPVVRTAKALLRVSPGGEVRLPYLVGDDHAIASVRLLRDDRDAVFVRSPDRPATRVMQGMAVVPMSASLPFAAAQFRLEAKDSRGAVVLGEPVTALLGDTDVGVFDQLRPALLLAARQSLADAIDSLRQLEAALDDPAMALERKEDAAERLRRGLERIVVAATDAEELLEPMADLADRLASIRREVMELPPEPARATDVERLRQAVEREQARVVDVRRAALAWLIDAATPSKLLATTRPASRELASALERARSERQSWARELGVRLDDPTLPGTLDRLVAAVAGMVASDTAALLSEWREGGSSESIADRLLVQARVRAMSRRPRPVSVADGITLARAVRAIGRREVETTSRRRHRLLEDWEALQEARAVGAVFAAARVERHLQALGESESVGQSLLDIAREASSAGEPLRDLSDRWRTLHSVADRLDPADFELLRGRLLEEAEAILKSSSDSTLTAVDPVLQPGPDTGDVLDRLAEEVSASRFHDLLWQGGETSEPLRAALNPEPTRGLPRALALLTERVGRLLDPGEAEPRPPSGGHRDAEAVRAYFRLLSRDTGD